eukprot:1798917-Prymnesium_polylepis.2
MPWPSSARMSTGSFCRRRLSLDATHTRSVVAFDSATARTQTGHSTGPSTQWENFESQQARPAHCRRRLRTRTGPRCGSARCPPGRCG